MSYSLVADISKYRTIFAAPSASVARRFHYSNKVLTQHFTSDISETDLLNIHVFTLQQAFTRLDKRQLYSSRDTSFC